MTATKVDATQGMAISAGNIKRMQNKCTSCNKRFTLGGGGGGGGVGNPHIISTSPLYQA